LKPPTIQQTSISANSSSVLLATKSCKSVIHLKVAHVVPEGAQSLPVKQCPPFEIA
jgi:hypothetical protein